MSPLDRRDLRGWHYVLTGGSLACLSPWGFDAGMTGRWAYVADSPGDCAGALARLRLILDAAGTAPAVPGTAARPFQPDPRHRSRRAAGPAGNRTSTPVNLPAHSLIVAYDLTATDPAAVAALRLRAPGQILFERATCWTDPPRVTADMSGLLGQTTVPPWEPHLQPPRRRHRRPGPADDRPIEEVAGESPAPRPNRMKATRALPRTPTTTCADSSERSRPRRQANATAAGPAASASTSPTRAPCPAAASPELPRRSRAIQA